MTSHHKQSATRGGTKSHRKSDSGVGSFSDHAGAFADPDRGFTERDYQEQRANPGALREALDFANVELAKLRRKYESVGADLTQARKDLKEQTSHYQAVADHNEVLEDSIKRIKKQYAADVDELTAENEYLREELRRAQAALVRSGVAVEAAEPLKRSKSRSGKEKDRKSKEKDKEKERLASRFERSDDDRSDSSGNKRPYMEKWGPVSSPRVAQQQFDTYATSPTHPTVSYMPINEPTFSSVPHSLYPLSPRSPRTYEDGAYHHYPLPSKKDKR